MASKCKLGQETKAHTGRQAASTRAACSRARRGSRIVPAVPEQRAVKGPDGLARQISFAQPALIPVVYHRAKCSVWQKGGW